LKNVQSVCKFVFYIHEVAHLNKSSRMVHEVCGHHGNKPAHAVQLRKVRKTRL